MKLFRNLFLCVFLLILATPAVIAFVFWSPDAEMPEIDITDFDPEEAMKAKVVNSFLNSAIGSNNVVFEEDLFNKIIYSAVNDQIDFDTAKVNIKELNNLEIGFKGVWVNLKDDHFYFKALGAIGGYKTCAAIDFRITDGTDDVKLEFDGVKIGKIGVRKTTLEKILRQVVKQAENAGNSVDFDSIEEDVKVGVLDIDTLMYSVTNDELNEVLRDAFDFDDTQMPIVFTGVEIIDGAVLVHYDIDESTDYGATVVAVREEVNRLLQDEEFEQSILEVEGVDGTDFEEEFTNVVDALQEAASGSSGDFVEPDLTEEEMTDFAESFAELPEETQQEVIDTMVDSIDPSVIDQLEEMFGGQLPNSND